MLENRKKKTEETLDRIADYDFVMDDICENNRKVIMIICSICTAIFSVLLVLGLLRIGVDAEDMPVFLVSLLCALAVLLFVWRTRSQNVKMVMAAMYLTVAAVMFYGLLVSYRAPEQYTVTFIAMMGIVSMTFLDRPIRMLIANMVATAICVGMIFMHKAESIRAADSINVLCFSIMAFIGGYFNMKTKLHSFVMDKSHEKDMEKGQKRLNEVESEALQFLIAVKSTHDMVVSVNLTQNTYKLIGDTSFVTRGDAIVGNFDEVIDIHASKVVEEHRKLYYDTFSRKGLLAAHAAGKREVYLEYQQCDEEGIPHWLGTHTMFIEDPHSTDVTEITISQNIDERIRKEEEIKAILQEERDKAEQAQKAKTDFLFQMSHDIRTPMNAIIGFTNFIRSSDDLYVIHNEYVPKLKTAGEQLLMLINDALEMSRIESGKLVFRRDTQDIRMIIANVMTLMQTQAEEKGLEMVTDIAVEDPIVYCDQNHLNRVIMNLVSNAVKFTPSGGRITVSLRQKVCAEEGHTRFELKIADTGIGMSPEFLEKVFEPFEREQSSTASGVQGTGLGLAIVKRIVDTANDHISVKSEQGKGTVFTIDLTLYTGDPSNLSDESHDEGGALFMEAMAEQFKGKRILLVEDNEFNLTIAQTLLENAGFCVETATNGQMAVEKVANSPADDYYDVILMDVQMPIMDGYAATRTIRALSGGRAQTKIVALTANAFDTDRENAIAVGMNGHIAKPIDVATLYKTLWSLL